MQLEEIQPQQLLDWAYKAQDAATERAVRHDLQRIIEATSDLMVRMGEEPVHATSTAPRFGEDHLAALEYLVREVEAIKVWRAWVERPRWWHRLIWWRVQPELG